VTGRTLQVADAEAVAALLSRIADADGTGWVDAADVRSWPAMPGALPENFRLFEQDGVPVAYADVYVAPGASDRAWADVRVAPERRGAEPFGWCNGLGVRRPSRRRGLGLALLRHAFRELRSRGLSCAGLGVDGSNPTGAVQLYERAGMHVASRSDTWELRLDPSGG
jgi:ribosomal protein S18 acetylase RimI-like enzyme